MPEVGVKSRPDLGKRNGESSDPSFHLHESPSSPYVLPVPPRRLCVGAGALSPEKGGALRKQSTRGRRLGVATVLCGGVFAAPLLLLSHGSAHAGRVTTASSPRAAHAAGGPRAYGAALPSQLVGYKSTPTPTTTTTPTTVTTPPPPPPSTTTTTTTAPPPPPAEEVSRARHGGRPHRGAGHRRECARTRDQHRGRAGPGHVVRRRTRGDVRQPQPRVRDRLDGDECRDRGQYDVHRR